jgi:hypothetical protein
MDGAANGWIGWFAGSRLCGNVRLKADIDRAATYGRKLPSRLVETLCNKPTLPNGHLGWLWATNA